MRIRKYILKRIHAKVCKSLFILRALIKARLSYKRKLKIIFSKHEGWEHNLRMGFRFTQHKITFEDFSPSNIKNYDLVVPLFIRDLIYLNEVRHLIKNNPIPIPNMESLALCNDKYLFNQAMEINGFGRFIPKMGGTLKYPYILKKRIDDSSLNSHIILNSDHEQMFKAEISNIEYFRQEVIVGSKEYATHILIKNREIVHSINIEYVFDKGIPIKGRDKAIYTKMCRCPYLDIFAAILASIDFEGLCCVNYKVVDSRPFVLEINPRFGGSLCPFFFSFIDQYGI